MTAKTLATLPASAVIVCSIVCLTLAVHSDVSEMSKLVGLDFEVFGRVQGVFFRKVSSYIVAVWLIDLTRNTRALGKIRSSTRGRKSFGRPAYTQKRGEELGLKGWCMNTKGGTVVGRIEGEQSKIQDMKHWLQKTGSPQSLIDKAEFRNEKEITELSFPDFSVKK